MSLGNVGLCTIRQYIIILSKYQMDKKKNMPKNSDKPYSLRDLHIILTCQESLTFLLIMFDDGVNPLFLREWTGDLKKLPNLKLRKVSNKGLDTKNEEEEKHDAEEDNEDDEDDLDDEKLDDMVLMSD